MLFEASSHTALPVRQNVQTELARATQYRTQQGQVLWQAQTYDDRQTDRQTDTQTLPNLHSSPTESNQEKRGWRCMQHEWGDEKCALTL